jgi:ATP-dependent DNA helicase DinG
VALHVEAVLSDTGPLARRLGGFEVRPQQLEMARLVQENLERGGRLMVEAGTGVGKSFAYLIPSIRRIVENRERIVVATNTISLQEQLIDKDIPLLRAVAADEFSAVLVKGRNNYVSLRRLRLASQRQERLFPDEQERHALHQLEDWAMETRDGSLSSLPVQPSPAVWEQAQSDPHNCMGRRCPTYDKCFYQAARRRMENADLLVCNHAIFFSDLALRARGRGFLPDYRHVILDEAHEIEDVASEHFGLKLSEASVRHLLRALLGGGGRGFLPHLRVRSGTESRVDEAIELVEGCEQGLEALAADLWALARSGGEGGGERRIAPGESVDDALSAPMRQLAGALRLLKEDALEEADAFELNAYAERADAAAASASALLLQSLPGCVYWVETRKARGKGRPPVSLAAAAVDVAPILREQLFARPVSVTLTSATLSTGPGDFGLVARRLGCDDARTAQLGSPFDFASQVRLLVDRGMPEPSHPHYEQALAQRILLQVRRTDGGAFVLFTNAALMERVARRVEDTLAEFDHPVFVQNRGMARGVMLQRFMGERRAVLFGVQSFWQGVDVRGDALRNVIITRLPFESPDRPLTKARGERVEAQGGDAFGQDSLPRAILRFRQGFGRLIRSGSDRGQVVVLDARIVTKGYGAAFLRALPEGVEPRWLDEEMDPPNFGDE